MQKSTLTTPKLLSRVSAGTPAGLTPELEFVDLNSLLADENCVLLQVSGSSMESAICEDDWLIVKRDKMPRAGDTVIASLDGEYTAKMYKPQNNGLTLVPLNKNYVQIDVKKDFQIVGVVVWILKRASLHLLLAGALCLSQ